MSTELERLKRICDALVEAFEVHPETRRTDCCLISLDNGEGATVEDFDERPSAPTIQPATTRMVYGRRARLPTTTP